MRKIFRFFNDPVQWANTIVGTRLRFRLFALGIAYVTIGVVTRVASVGGFSVWYGILFIMGLQLLILYVLRRLYLRIVGEEQ